MFWAGVLRAAAPFFVETERPFGSERRRCYFVLLHQGVPFVGRLEIASKRYRKRSLDTNFHRFPRLDDIGLATISRHCRVATTVGAFFFAAWEVWDDP